MSDAVFLKQKIAHYEKAYDEIDNKISLLMGDRIFLSKLIISLSRTLELIEEAEENAS